MKEDGNDVFSDLIDPSDDTIVFYGDARQIKATALENLVGKAYMNVLPMYISDIKDTMEAATVCGRVVGLEKREYRNKNFGLNLPTGGRFKKNTTDEKLPMYTFTIDDTTGKLSVVYFARDTKVNALDLSLRDEKNVVISGKLSDRNGSKQIMVDKMWLADVDYSTIKTELPQKSANKNYYLVRPEKYFEESQSSMDDLLGGEKEVAPYLKGKTFVVFDLETTGLDVQHCMVVQLGSYKIVDGKIVETFNTLINPCCHIPEATSAIHGIYDSDVVCAPEFKDVVPDFSSLPAARRLSDTTPADTICRYFRGLQGKAAITSTIPCSTRLSLQNSNTGCRVTISETLQSIFISTLKTRTTPTLTPSRRQNFS